MDTQALQYFVTLYRLQNMHKAADALFITQQGLSRSIQSLEKEWEVQLFERSKYGMYPTREGERFYRTALNMLKELRELQQELHSISGGKKILRLACSYGTLHILYPSVCKFREHYPDIEVKWVEYPDVECDRELLNMDVDAAFCVDGPGQDNLLKFPMFSSAITLLVYQGHPFWNRTEVFLDDLRNECIMMEGSGFHIFSFLQKKCLEKGFYPDIIAQTAEINLLNKLCRMKEGIAIAVDFISDIYGTEDLKGIPFADPDFTWDVCLAVNPQDRNNPILDSFIRFMQEEAKHL